MEYMRNECSGIRMANAAKGHQAHKCLDTDKAKGQHFCKALVTICDVPASFGRASGDQGLDHAARNWPAW
jgi:hypothetical protein